YGVSLGPLSPLKGVLMLSRTTLLAGAMLGLGTLLGYHAAWGRFPAAAPVSAAEPAPRATADAPKPCCDGPDRKTVFTSAQAGQPAKEWQTPKPGNPRGSTTGPTDAPGYDHPNQYMIVKPTEIAPNMEPVIVHTKQLEEAKAKLAKAHEK